MNRYFDNRDQSVLLGTRIGVGGEGTVFEVQANPNYVAKIYHQPASQEKASKLRLMTGITRQEILRFAAWPKTTLHDRPGGAICGTILPRINAREIHDLYGPKHRAIHFPTADWRFLIRAALNTAAAFDTLHRHGVVIGDVNESGVFVNADATIKLIDCDSFQIQAEGTLYKCRVGVPNFTPPELQTTRSFDKIRRTVNHDNFGLAVLIFHLLFMGRHPFSGRYSGSGDMPIERAIEQYRFAYSRSSAKSQMSPPPHCLQLTDASPDIAFLFEKAFGHGSANPNARPSAEEWGNQLVKLESQLRPCSQDEGHFFVANQSCPWCRLAAQSGKNYFASVALNSILRKSAAFSITQVWDSIEALGRPGYISASRVAKSIVKPSPFDEANTSSHVPRLMTGWIALVSACVMPFAASEPTIALFSIPLSVVFGLWWALLWINRPLRRERRNRRIQVITKKDELRLAQHTFEETSQRYRLQFDNKLETLRQARRELEALHRKCQDELTQLQHTVKERQLEEYLGKCFLRNAKIPGIGPGRINTLESYGIETADDITYGRLSQVPGFGPVLTGELFAWRTAKERQFRFDPSKGVPPSATNALEMKYTQRRFVLEQHLLLGRAQLTQIIHAAKSELSRLDRRVAKAEFALAQAECNFSAL